MATPCNDIINEQFRVSHDGYIRIPAEKLGSIQLLHLDSGIYSPEDQYPLLDRTRCKINGYTEWISLSSPYVSVGWDWDLIIHGTEPDLIKTGDVYTNLMMQSESNTDLSERENRQLIADSLSSLDWKSKVKSFITLKYA